MYIGNDQVVIVTALLWLIGVLTVVAIGGILHIKKNYIFVPKNTKESK